MTPYIGYIYKYTFPNNKHTLNNKNLDIWLH